MFSPNGCQIQHYLYSLFYPLKDKSVDLSNLRVEITIAVLNEIILDISGLFCLLGNLVKESTICLRQVLP